MENNSQTAPTNKTKEYERLFHADLHNYLTSIGLVDKHFPEAPDIEERWAKIGESYMPDGIREFNGYPTAALGWMMYVGMAVAKYWDLDWDLYGKVDDLYRYLRDRIGYDDMDTYISEKVLLLDEGCRRPQKGHRRVRLTNLQHPVAPRSGARFCRRVLCFHCRTARHVPHGECHATEGYGLSHD